MHSFRNVLTDVVTEVDPSDDVTIAELRAARQPGTLFPLYVETVASVSGGAAYDDTDLQARVAALEAAPASVAKGVRLRGDGQNVLNNNNYTVLWQETPDLTDDAWDDAPGFFSAAANDRITIPVGEAGDYIVGCRIQWDGQAAPAGHRKISLQILNPVVNNIDQVIEDRMPAMTDDAGGNGPPHGVSEVVRLTEGQWLRVWAHQTSGVTLLITPHSLFAYRLK